MIVKTGGLEKLIIGRALTPDSSGMNIPYVAFTLLSWSSVLCSVRPIEEYTPDVLRDMLDNPNVEEVKNELTDALKVASEMKHKQACLFWTLCAVSESLFPGLEILNALFVTEQEQLDMLSVLTKDSLNDPFILEMISCTDAVGRFVSYERPIEQCPFLKDVYETNKRFHIDQYGHLDNMSVLFPLLPPISKNMEEQVRLYERALQILASEYFSFELPHFSKLCQIYAFDTLYQKGCLDWIDGKSFQQDFLRIGDTRSFLLRVFTDKQAWANIQIFFTVRLEEQTPELVACLGPNDYVNVAACQEIFEETSKVLVKTLDGFDDKFADIFEAMMSHNQLDQAMMLANLNLDAMGAGKGDATEKFKKLLEKNCSFESVFSLIMESSFFSSNEKKHIFAQVKGKSLEKVSESDIFQAAPSQNLQRSVKYFNQFELCDVAEAKQAKMLVEVFGEVDWRALALGKATRMLFEEKNRPAGLYYLEHFILQPESDLKLLESIAILPWAVETYELEENVADVPPRSVSGEVSLAAELYHWCSLLVNWNASVEKAQKSMGWLEVQFANEIMPEKPEAVRQILKFNQEDRIALFAVMGYGDLELNQQVDFIMVCLDQGLFDHVFIGLRAVFADCQEYWTDDERASPYPSIIRHHSKITGKRTKYDLFREYTDLGKVLVAKFHEFKAAGRWHYVRYLIWHFNFDPIWIINDPHMSDQDKQGLDLIFPALELDRLEIGEHGRYPVAIMTHSHKPSVRKLAQKVDGMLPLQWYKDMLHAMSND